MKRMQKPILLILIAILILTLSACGSGNSKGGSNDSDSKSAASAGDFHIAYAAVTTSLAPWVVALANSFKEMCETNGWQYDIYDGEGNPSVQTEQINSIISDGDVDLVVLFPVDSEVGVQYVKDLTSAGIDVVTLGADVSEAGQADVKFYVGPDQPGMVKMETDYIKDNLGTTDALNYVILSGFDMQYDYIVRERTVNEQFEGLPYKQLDVTYCGASRDAAMEAMANYLVAYDDINFVVCLSDEFALGAIKAIEDAKREGDITVVSIECFQASIPLIKDGELAMSVTMTGADTIKKLDEALKKYLDGGEVDYYQYAPMTEVTKANAEEISGLLEY